MTAPYDADWEERTACTGEDTELFFATNPAAALKVCGRCAVRPECLYDAVQRERVTVGKPYGVRGGLTAAERCRLPELPATKADAIATLRELLPAPEADAPPERNDLPMSGIPTVPTPAPAVTPPSAAAASEASEKLPIGKLLAWGDKSSDPAARADAQQAREALTRLRHRHAVQQKLAALDTEEEQLKRQLAELQARRAELAPRSRRRPHSYKAIEVRAWAKENGVDCPPTGRVPNKVVDAWRAAIQGADRADA